MTTLSLPISLFTFLILLSSSITLSQSKDAKLITEQLIHKVCSQTRNPSLCLNNLKSLEGKSLMPNSITALGSNSMDMALHQANTTADLIWQRYRGTSIDKREIRLRYHTCFMIYSVDLKNQLTKAKEYMLAGVAKSFEKCVSFADKRVDSCNKELMKQPRDVQSGVVLEVNGVFKDICSIILAICNKVPK